MPSASRPLPELVLVGHRAGGGRRAEERAAEARALLVGPVHEPDGQRRPAFRRDAAQHLDPGETFRQPSSQPPFGTESMWPPISSVAIGIAREREPLVARRVDLLGRAGLRDLVAQPRASGLPGVGPGDALGAVFVSCQLAELLELGDRPLRIECHSASLTTVLEPSDGVSRS